LRTKDDMRWSGMQKHYHSPGTEPGTLAEHHPACDGALSITQMQYSPDYFAEKKHDITGSVLGRRKTGLYHLD